MFWCDHIYFEKTHITIHYFYIKCYILVETVKYTFSFCQKDENYIRKSNELLKDYHLTSFLQQLIIVSQNLKFGLNMGLNVPTHLHIIFKLHVKFH